MIILSTLDSGIRVAMEKIPHVQSVSLGVWVHAGAVFESARKSGISHFIEHMLFKGTKNRSAKQIAEDVDRIGGQMNAFTSKEATCYYLKILSTNFTKGAEILSDMLLNSLFDRDEMDKERNVICEEIKMIEDSPEDDVHEIISEEIFHGSSLAKSVIGTPSTLNQVKAATIREYLRRYYTLENIVLAIAGNFDETEVCEVLNKHFSALPSSVPDISQIHAEYAPRFRTKVKDIEQSHICLAAKSVKMDHDRYYSLVLLNNIMGGSMSSRLFQNIREQKGLAYAVYSMNSSYKEDGYFYIYAAVSHENVSKAMTAILEELGILSREGITEEELSIAKEQMKSQYIFSQENVNGRMFSIGKNCLLLNRVYTPEEIIANMDAVGMDDIAEAARMVTDPMLYSGVLLGRKRLSMRRMIQGA